LRTICKTLKEEAQNFSEFSDDERHSSGDEILSNYVPNCIVRAEVSVLKNLLKKNIENPNEFAEKFVQAVRIAEVEPFRAHNKGIMNGVDAVV
jgi:hydroxymethylglutaryl-CoA reductase